MNGKETIMAKTFVFTQTSVGKLQAPASGVARFKDAKTPGLYVRILPSGRTTFEAVRHVGTRYIRQVIGTFPGMTVGQARLAATEIGVRMAKGENLADERRKARAEMAFGELFALYLDGYAKHHKRERSWKEDERQNKAYLSKWQRRKLSEIDRADVSALHAKLGRDNGPYQANRVLAMLSAIFNYASNILGYEGRNPAKGVKKFKEQSRDRFLHADELRAFFTALADEQTPELWRDFFIAALLTGARRSNVEAMKWTDLELGRGIWRIPETQSKNKEPLVCVLHPNAVEILRRRAEANAAKEEPSAFVFPSWGKTGHVTEPKKAWTDLLERAGIKGLHVHDLRRTLGSWQAATGASLSIIGRTLGHKNIATTAVYARLDLDPVRVSVQAAGDAMLAAGTLKALPEKAL
jgi:integrase